MKEKIWKKNYKTRLAKNELVDDSEKLNKIVKQLCV